MSESQSTSSLNVVEFWKCNFEFFKHLTSLSTGSILIIALFLEKVFATPICKQSMVVSLAGFLITIFSATLAYGVAVTAMPRPAKEPTGREINMIAVAIAIAWMAFFTGVLALTVFILENCLN